MPLPGIGFGSGIGIHIGILVVVPSQPTTIIKGTGKGTRKGTRTDRSGWSPPDFW